MSAYLSVNESAWNDSDRDFGRVLKEIIGRAPAPVPVAAAGGAGAAPRSLLNAALNKPGPMINEDEGGWNYEEPVAGPVEKLSASVKPLDIAISNANANAGLSTVDQLNDAIMNKNVKKLSMLLLAGAQIKADILAVLYYHWMSLFKSANPDAFKFCIALMEWLSDKLPEAFRTKIPLPGGGYFSGARNVPEDGMVDAGFFLNLIGNEELARKYLESEAMKTLLSDKQPDDSIITAIYRSCKINSLKFAKVAIVKFLGEVEGAEKIRRIRLLKPYLSACMQHPSIAALLTGMGVVGGARKRRSTHRVRKNRKGTRSRR
jgi:hypothetical protein